VSPKDDPESCAFHEAGHAVVAYEYGWYLRHGGVRIGKNAEARLRTPDELRTPEAEIIVALAGWVADAKYCGVKSLVAYDEILDWIKDLRRNPEACNRLTSFNDPHDVARPLLKAYPHLSDRGAYRMVQRYERETAALLAEPRVWSAVERLAAALLRRGQLSHAAAVNLLRSDFFAGVHAVHILNVGAHSASPVCSLHFQG
jgi:hypothetical protein